MAWVQVHQALRTHRKTLAFAAALDISLATAVGYLVFLWLWALDNAPTGDLNGVNPQQLASAMMFTTSRKRSANDLVNALVSSGFVDRKGRTRICLHIHDWEDYGGKLCTAREKHRERMFQARASLDKSRVDKSRVDKNTPPVSPPKGGRRRRNYDGPLSGKHHDKVKH